MASYIFDGVKLKIFTGNMDFEFADGDLKLALVTSAVFANWNTGALSDSDYWYELSAYEITEDSNYNTSGYSQQDLNNVGLNEIDVNGFTHLVVSADDINFAISTIDAYGAVIYESADESLVVAVNFNSLVSSNNGTFNIPLSTTGVLKLQ
jgi:hypothetical protein